MLGVCVAYLFHDEYGLTLLDLSLAQLGSLTTRAFRIFACGLRLAPEHEARVRAHGIDLIDVPPFDRTGPAEHAYCLGRLTDAAFLAGCSQVATFDLDSWPLIAGWNRLLVELLTPGRPIVASSATNSVTIFRMPPSP